MAPASRDIILYHYYGSPFGARVVWYLNLRKIPYTQCLQPNILPRPDVAALGIAYRRIPLMLIGRSAYVDTRLIIAKLEALFPASASHPAISSSTPEGKALERLLEFWAVDAAVFHRIVQLMPTSSALLKDEKFIKDREGMSGRPWRKEAIDAMRPEAVVEVKSMLGVLENTLLSDGREWVLGSQGPSLADIEAVWSFHWLRTPLFGTIDGISAQQFPKVFAWIDRFDAAVLSAAKSRGRPPTIKGKEAAERIAKAEFAEECGDVDPKDATGLKRGQEIEVFPIDSGFNNKDRGTLVALSTEEIVVETRMEKGGVVRIHAPRHGFRVRAIKGGKSTL